MSAAVHAEDHQGGDDAPAEVTALPIWEHSDDCNCYPCREALMRMEILADPYYSGDYYAMFGDDE